MQIIVDDLVANYVNSGSGKTVLLLHGWGSSINTFSRLQSDLARNYQVISLDLPGFGQSSMPPETWDLANYANFVAHFLKKLRIDCYAVIGHSNGGSIIIYALAHKILSAQRLVLIASAGVRDKQKVKKSFLKAIAKSGKAATIALPKVTRDKLKRQLYEKAGSEMLLVPHMEETFKRVVSYDVQADAKMITLPALLIYGTSDTATPIEYAHLLASSLANSRLKTIEGGDHFIHENHSREVVNLIEEFLK